ncbi:MAG: hypothetical protein ACH344_11390 [Yersinia sp. (in: enterobacteria)]
MNTEQLTEFAKLTRIQQAIASAELAGTDLRDAYRQAGGKASSDAACRVAIHRARHHPAVVAILATMKTKAQKSMEKAVVSRTEALERLSSIVRNREDDRASMIAIKQLAEMEGWEAPKKTETAVTERLALADFYTDTQIADLDRLADKWRGIGQLASKIATTCS